MLTLCSPAKINLFLKVIRKRPDGYHDLASLFQAIDLHDTLDFTFAQKDELTCTDSSIPLGPENLILKAVHLFRQKTGLNFKIKIHLVKNIPSQAGLGGGSSNAATTLWALNQLHNYPATLPQLSEWAAEIGSDVSFFFSQGTAFCTGRGEKLTPLTLNFSSPPFWIVKPQEGLSTPQVFKQLHFPTTPSIPLTEIEHLINTFLVTPTYFNDLEKPAFQLLPELASLKERLLTQGFETVVMTGSGSALFCLGQGSPPIQEGLFAASCAFINRPSHEWYVLSENKK